MSKYFKEDRINTILKQIQNGQCVTLINMADRLGVSTKTLKNDIKLLNDILEQTAFIENDQGEYRLYVVDQIGFREKQAELDNENLNLDSPKKRMAYIFKILMTLKAAIPIDELSYKMNTGRTTIVGDIKNLNEILEKYDLSIHGKPNSGISLVGSEFQIRQFVLENIFDLIFFPCENNMIFDTIMNFVIKEYKFEEVVLTPLRKNIVIMIDRVSAGYEINNLEDKYHFVEEHLLFPLVELIADELEMLFQISLSKNERIFMAIPVVGMRTPTNIDTISRLAITDDIIDVVDKMCLQIKEELNLSLSSKHLHEEFFYHIFFMVDRLKLGYFLNNPIALEMKEKYQLAYQMALIAGKVVENEYNLVVTEDEIGYITAYFGAYMLENRVPDKKYKIALICSTGRGTARLILSHLKLIFDKDTVFDMYASHGIDEKILSKYDLIFTTIKLDCVVKVPMIEINDIFDEQEIRTQIKKVFQLHKLNTHHTERGGDSVIVSILEKEKFFVLDSKKEYMDNLLFMVEQLETMGCVDSEFRQRIIDRENKSIMVFDKKIAFPHTINYQSEKLTISIGVSNAGIACDTVENAEIKLIFLLGLPENENEKDDDQFMVRIYDEIISIAQNKYFIDELSACTSFHDLIKKFIKLGVGNNL